MMRVGGNKAATAVGGRAARACGWGYSWLRPHRLSSAVHRCAAVAAFALALAGCASTDAVETAALAKAPIATGKARVIITRVSTLQYAAAPATITLNGQKVAAVVDVPAGANVLAASAWSYPGEYNVKLNAEPGKTYALEVSPRSDSLGPSILLGPIGGMIDSAANENAGAFEIRMVGQKSATSRTRDGIEEAALMGELGQGIVWRGPQDRENGVQVPESERQLWTVEVIATFEGVGEMIKDLKVQVHSQTPLRQVTLGPNREDVVTLPT